MATATEAPLPSASTESNLLDVNGTPPPNQVVLDANNSNTIIQNNIMGEGVTLNIRSSNCNGSSSLFKQAVTKLEYVVGTAERTSSQPPMARQLVPVEYGRESVIFSGNTFGSHNCTGAKNPPVDRLVNPGVLATKLLPGNID
ncbi:hypothetical protein EV424DRAFT_1346431 [Suillus variegatus]|nr:hypothetical protein EV424DRAFT_1346431 [Suillus variegatus]